MPDVAFKDLCLDTTRPDLVAPFWAGLLDLRALRQDNGDYHLTGPVKQRTIWVNTVPEALTVKNRVHLDLRVADADGSALVSDQGRWQVRADPEGLQFCAFPGSEGLFEICVDSTEPRAIAQWWADRLGTTVSAEDGKDWVRLEDAAGFPYEAWVFNPVPEPKTVKNRVHWDVTLLDATVEDLVAAGATVVRAKDDEIAWTVLADPEGNEFCAFEP